MRLVVKQLGVVVREYSFDSGPIYIGRHANSQVFLPDQAVSRQHAVIFNTKDGKWVAEDLDSANKTVLNNEPIHKSEIKTGDILNIVNYSIEIYLDDTRQNDRPINLEDTLTTTAHEEQVIVRRLDAEHVPDMRFPAKRASDFLQASDAICNANGPQEILQVLLNITLKQFSAFHVWCGLRTASAGELIIRGGKKRGGFSVDINEIKLKDKIITTMEKERFLLIPRIVEEREKEKIKSAMIAPLLSQGGCFGVIYIDNAFDHEHYSLADIDYLMMLSIHAASVLKDF